MASPLYSYRRGFIHESLNLDLVSDLQLSLRSSSGQLNLLIILTVRAASFLSTVYIAFEVARAVTLEAVVKIMWQGCDGTTRAAILSRRLRLIHKVIRFFTMKIYQR